MKKTKVLLSGSTGFFGSAVSNRLEKLGYLTSYPVRRLRSDSIANTFEVGDIGEAVDYSAALNNVDIVIHAAARAHIMVDKVHDPLSEYRRINVHGSLNLARQASKSGVKRFIFISSIKVLGEDTSSIEPFSEESNPSPQDYYGQSKLEAEEVLKQFTEKHGMQLVIIRPPVIYGPGAKGNIYNLLKISSLNLPLPFGMVNNKRSMIYVENLVDFVICCANNPAAANQTFLISDNYDLSLRSLLIFIRKSMNRSAMLIPVPVSVFKIFGTLFRKEDMIGRLIGDLQINPSKAMNVLGWQPPYTVEQGIKVMVDSFLECEN